MKLEQQEQDLRERRRDGLTRQHDSLARSRELALREYDAGVISRDEYRGRVVKLEEQSDRITRLLFHLDDD